VVENDDDSSSSCDEGAASQRKNSKVKTAPNGPSSRTSARVKAKGVGSSSEVNEFALTSPDCIKKHVAPFFLRRGEFRREESTLQKPA
jgi:hypothetical protein